MLYILNPYQPMYWEKSEFRLYVGGLKETGFYIEKVNQSFFKVLMMARSEISEKALVEAFREELSISESSASGLLYQLCNAGVLVNSEVYKSELKNTSRYDRQQLYFSMLNSHSGINTQIFMEKITSSTIVIMGLGGIVSNCALQLANSGVQGLILCDCDKVEETNLVRQFLYRSKDISNFKTLAALRNLGEIRNDLCIQTINKVVKTTKDAREVIEGADCVICTMDKPRDLIKRIVNEACVEENVPVIFAGFSEHMGLVGPLVIPYLSPCYECQRAQLPTIDTSVRMNPNIIAPSFGPLCMAISVVTVDEVIRQVSGYVPPQLIGKTLMMNGNDYTTKTSQWVRALSCPVCGKSKTAV